jgi:SAM-dependent methyltransferase
MYDERVAVYYDRLYEKKAYQAEVDFLLEVYGRYKGTLPQRVLDVGCGTGSHAILLAQKGCTVTGIDKSEAMIKVALAKKKRELPVNFFCVELEDLEGEQNDMAISMFNVVNHILHARTLRDFFVGINRNLNHGGIFVFDCWNGVAAVREPPRNDEKQFTSNDGSKFLVRTNVTTNLMDLLATVYSDITVEGRDGKVVNLQTNYKHLLWPPRILSDMLEIAGFQVRSWTKAYKMSEIPSEADWKVAVVAQKQ